MTHKFLKHLDSIFVTQRRQTSRHCILDAVRLSGEPSTSLRDRDPNLSKWSCNFAFWVTYAAHGGTGGFFGVSALPAAALALHIERAQHPVWLEPDQSVAHC